MPQQQLVVLRATYVVLFILRATCVVLFISLCSTYYSLYSTARVAQVLKMDLSTSKASEALITERFKQQTDNFNKLMKSNKDMWDASKEVMEQLNICHKGY